MKVCSLLALVGLIGLANPPSAAGAEPAESWTHLVAAADAEWYFDEALGRKRGTMAKVWTLQQYRTAQPLQGGAYRSSKTQIEVRCHSRQWRVFYFSAYSGEMGTGEQSYAQATAGAWKDVQAESVSEAVYRVGCHPGENQ